MKRNNLTVKRTVALAISMAILTVTVTGCGMAKTYETTATAPAEAPAATEEAMYDEYPEYDVYEGYADYEACEEAADEYNVYDYEGDVYAYGPELSAACDEAITNDGGSYAYASKRAGSESRNKEESYLDDIYDYDRRDDDFDHDDSNEEYSELNEQGFKSVKSHPLSTFAADVDTASYSNLRRMINDGYRLNNLPENSVRIEEMLNYFDYDYAGPKGNEPFGVNTEITACPWNDDSLLLSIGLKTEDIDFSNTPDSNLVFLIDVSGSMNDYDKLPLLQEAFCMLTDELSDKDRVSIVTYANGVNIVLAGEKGSNGRKIKRAINDLFASGGTNGGEGIQTAYKLAEKNFIKGGNNRIILATDGDLNIGLTSVSELEDLISKKKESGVYLSVLGFGTGNIKDNRMETLADKGNGNYSYIDSVREAKKVMVDELSANLLTVCKDVKLQVEFNPEFVKGYRLVGYANRVMKDKDFNDDKKDGGEIGAGHELTVLYELIPQEGYGYDRDEIDRSSLKYSDQHKKTGEKYRKELRRNDELLTLSIRYKKPAEDKSNLLEYPVTFASYTDTPSEDLIFQSAVAEFGLLASDSLYSGDADLNNVIDRLGSIRLNDEYKQEFYDMISAL